MSVPQNYFWGCLLEEKRSFRKIEKGEVVISNQLWVRHTLELSPVHFATPTPEVFGDRVQPTPRSSEGAVVVHP